MNELRLTGVDRSQTEEDQNLQISPSSGKPKMAEVLSILLRCWGFLLYYWDKALAFQICVGMNALLGMLPPLLTKILIDHAFLHRDLSILLLVIVLRLAIFFIRFIFGQAQFFLDAFLNQQIHFIISRQIFEKFLGFSMRFFDRSKTGDVMFRSVEDTQAVVYFTVDLPQNLVENTVRLVFILLIAFTMEWRLSIVVLCSVPISFLLTHFLVGKRREFWELYRQKSSDITVKLQEAFSNIKLIKLFCREGAEVDRYSDRVTQRRRIEMRDYRFRFLNVFQGQTFSTFLELGIVLYIGYRVITGALSIGAFTALSIYLMRLREPFVRYLGMYSDLMIRSVSAEKLLETLDTQPEIKDFPDAIELEHIRGEIEFKDIVFGYSQDNPVLNGASFHVKPGEIVGISGASGVGKSTIVNLICRFYDPQEGQVLIDGHDIRQIKRSSLMSHVGVVLQEPILFNTTVKGNILYGKENATEAEMINAAKIANAHDFISSLESGYDTEVGDRGTRLSGGQRQRIALARTLLRDPRILILDEATSSVDSESESLIFETIRSLMRDRTILVITHRTHVFQDVDRVIEMENGDLLSRAAYGDGEN